MLNKAFNAIKSDGKKFFEKFEQWLYELVEAIKKFFKFGDESLLIRVGRRGRRLGQKLSKKDFEAIKGFLKTLDTELILFPVEGSHKIPGYFISPFKQAIFPESAAAMLITDGKKISLILREEATIYEFFHEYMHFKHLKSIGIKDYYKLGGRGTTGELIKEQWVFDKILKNKDLMTKNELEDALKYINKVRKNYNERLIEVEFSNIPLVRKEVKISQIIN